MFNKVLSCLTMMLFAFGMNVSAQEVKTQKINFGNVMPKFMNTPKTSVITPEDNEYWWGYWDGKITDGMRILGVGQNTQVPQDYNVCICIPKGSPIGSGMTIEALRFSLSDTKNVANVKMWISNTKPQNNNDASVCLQPVDKADLTSMMNPDDSFNDIRFDKPYKIPSDKDVYVGYSFTITADESQNDEYPIVVQTDTPTQENAMFIKFANGEWNDFKGSQNGNLAVQLLMSGDVMNNAAGLQKTFDPMFAEKNSEVAIPVVVDNRGQNGFESLGFTVSVDGKEEKVAIKPDYKIEGLNKTYEFELKVKTPEQTGTSEVKITLDEVNGKANSCKDNVMTGKIYTLSRKAQKKVVVEEFTAFWCGACPTGYVGLQKLRKEFGDDIVLISLHRSDPIECSDYVEFINATNTVGYPNSHIDRTYMDVYPYAGTGKNGRVGKAGFGGFGLGKDAEALMKVMPVAEVGVEGYIDGDILKAKATSKFLYSGDTDHALAFVVTENGMHDDDWVQSNYLADQKGWGWEEEEPLFDMWVNGEGKIKGVVYDDIAVAAEGVMYGIDGSIPATVKEDEAYDYEVEFDLANYYKIQDRKNLSVIAFIIDKTTGKIVNADCKKVGETSGIDCIDAENEDAAEVARYTVDGRRISAPEKGVNIVKYADGKVKKVIVR